jgi:sigma-B regulation protein RsbU (phosphoserine phosphatase)
MIEAKTFYRKLDRLQSKIGHEKSGKDFLFTIAKELEETFGDDLKITNGSIYEKADGEYLLISQPTLSKFKLKEKLLADSETVKLVLKSKTYIYDQPVFLDDNSLKNLKEYTTHVAFTVNIPLYSWIFVFELKSGWIREEIELCINAVRTAMNYRLISESVKSEMEQAVQIQQSLLPASAPEIPGYEIAGHSQQAELVGGDLYDYFLFDGGDFGFCIGDASGHGIPAALMVRDVVTGLRMGIEKDMKMVPTLKKLNSVIYQSGYSTRFISLFYAEMEGNGNIFYVNAGHPSPLLINGNKVSELGATGLIFGALPQVELQRSYAFLEKNGILVLYSDGIVERVNANDELFGVERLKGVVLKNKNLSAENIMKEIFNAAREFGNNKSWDDDATVIIIKR